MTKSVNILLVHGTWGKKSSFLEESSPLCKEVIEAVKPLSCKISKFIWSGNNSHRARNGAANELLKAIPSWSLNESLNVIICHSHGGNVVAKAVQDNEISKHVDYVVSMGTPYINVEKRNHRILTLFGSRTLSALSALFCFVALGLPFQLMPDPETAPWYVVLIELAYIIGLLLLVSGVFFGLGEYLEDKFSDWIEKKQDLGLSNHWKNWNNSVPLLCVTSIGDEPRILFMLWRFIESLSSMIIRTSSLLVRFFSSKIFLLFSYFITAAILMTFGIPPAAGLLSALFLVALAWFLLGITLAIGAVLPQLTRARVWGYGAENVLDTFFLQVKASATPSEAQASSLWKFSAVGALMRRFKKVGIYKAWQPGVVHSLPYTDDLAIRKIANSISSQIEK